MLDTMDKETLWKYLNYMAKRGDYMQVSDPSTAILLDDEHIRLVAREDQEWDNIDGDKLVIYLEKEVKKDRC